MITEEIVRALVNQHLGGTNHFLVDLAVKPTNKIFVYIDGDQGVTIDTCRELNRFIESVLSRDEEDYDLTVSSAGADAPLKLPRQYPKHIGRELELKLNDGNTVAGKLIRTTPDMIEIEPSTMVPFDQIREAYVRISFKKK